MVGPKQLSPSVPPPVILIVEDAVELREFAADVLGRLGYEVITAGTGPEAAAIFETDRKIDLLFTDIIIPGGMSGVSLARKACARRPGLKVLLTSGYAADHEPSSGAAANEFALIAKPYHVADLSKRVRFVLGGPDLAPF
jgi:CheY-like chemotaxis protein